MAGRRLVEVFELLEQILLDDEVEVRALFRLQRVSRTFQTTVNSSKSLQRKMFLKGYDPTSILRADFDAPYPAVVNPLLVEDIPIFRNFKIHLHPKIERSADGSKDVRSTDCCTALMIAGETTSIKSDILNLHFSHMASWRNTLVLGPTCDIYFCFRLWSPRQKADAKTYAALLKIGGPVALGIDHHRPPLTAIRYVVHLRSGATLGELADQIVQVLSDPNAGEVTGGFNGVRWLDWVGYKTLSKAGSPPPQAVSESRFLDHMQCLPRDTVQKPAPQKHPSLKTVLKPVYRLCKAVGRPARSRYTARDDAQQQQRLLT